jgi:hypothetical protein
MLINNSEYFEIYMRKFAEVFPDFQKRQRVVDFLPWRNILTADFVPEELADTLPSAEDIEKRVRLELDVEEGG